MAVRSIIDIQVNDQQWQAFMAMFNKYQQTLAQTPQQWTAAAQGAQNVQTVTHNVNLQLGVQGNLLKVIQGLQGRIQSTSLQTHRNWLGIATSAKQTAGSILQLGTALLKWGGLGGLVAGIGAGFGVEHLARSAVSRRSESLGLNTGAGQLGGLEAQAGDILDIHGLVSRVNELAHSADNTALVLAGVGRDAANRDASQVAEQAILAIQQQAKAADPRFLKDVFESREIGQLMSFEEFSRLRNLSSDEVRERFRSANQAGNRFGLDDATLKKWNDFTRSLDTAKTAIESFFIRKLSDLAPALGHFGDALEKVAEEFVGGSFDEAIKKFGKWIEETASYMETSEFKEKVKEWSEVLKTDIKEIGTALGRFLDLIKWVNSVVDKFFPSTEDKKTGRVGFGGLVGGGEAPTPQPQPGGRIGFGGTYFGDVVGPKPEQQKYTTPPDTGVSPFVASPALAPQEGGVDRSSFIPELTAHPELMLRAADMVQGEVGKNAPIETQKIQLETAFNRAYVRGHSLDQALLSVTDDPRRGYYAADTYSSAFGGGRSTQSMNEEEFRKWKRDVWDPVMAGDDTAHGFTGNASAGVAARQYARGTPGFDARASGGAVESYFKEGPFKRDLPRIDAATAAKPDTFESPKQAIRDYHGDVIDALRSSGSEKQGGWAPPSTALGYSDNKPHAVPKYQTNVTIQNNTGGSAISTVQSLPLQEAGGGFQNF